MVLVLPQGGTLGTSDVTMHDSALEVPQNMTVCTSGATRCDCPHYQYKQQQYLEVKVPC